MPLIKNSKETKQTSLQKLPLTKASEGPTHKKTGRPRGRPKTKLGFSSARELNDMVGLYIEEKLYDIVDKYQDEIMQYFENQGFTMIETDTYYDDINGGVKDAIDKESRVASDKAGLFRTTSCGLSYEDTL